MLFIHEYVKLTNTGLLLYIISFSTHWQISSFLCIKALHWWFSIFVHSLYRLIRWTIGESLYMLIKLWRHQLKTPHLITQNSYIIPQFTLQTTIQSHRTSEASLRLLPIMLWSAIVVKMQKVVRKRSESFPQRHMEKRFTRFLTKKQPKQNRRRYGCKAKWIY